MADYSISDAELPTMVVRCDNTLILRSVITGQHLRVLGTAPRWSDPPLPAAMRLQRQQIEREYNTALEAFVNLLPLAEVPKPMAPRAPVVPERTKSPVNQSAELPPCKVQRNYCCALCSYYTQNPRSHLLHQRDVHGIRLSIHSCQHCQYASRYFQKLKRHIKMVHTIDPTPGIATTTTVTAKSNTTRSRENNILPNTNETPTNLPPPATWSISQNVSKSAEEVSRNSNKPMEISKIPDKPSAIQKDPEAFFVAAYRNQLQKQYVHEQRVKEFVNAYREQSESKNELKLPGNTSPIYDGPSTSKAPSSVPSKEATTEITKLLTATKEAEKERVFSCRKCNYVTHIKSRYNKHVKYHSMPMIQCDKCEFRTTYKWNLTRHLRSHRDNGIYKCSVCTFSAHMKQSLTSHEMNHHSPPIGCANGSTPIRRRRCRVGGSDLHQPSSKAENEKTNILDEGSVKPNNQKFDENHENEKIMSNGKKENDKSEAKESMDVDTSGTDSSIKNDEISDSEIYSSSDVQDMDVDDCVGETLTSAIEPIPALPIASEHSMDLEPKSGIENNLTAPIDNTDHYSISTDTITESSDSESMNHPSDNQNSMEKLPEAILPESEVNFGRESKANSTTDYASECSPESSVNRELPNDFHVAYDSNSQSSSDSESSEESSDTSSESSSESSDSSKMTFI